MDTKVKVIKEISYKGHTLTHVEDEFHQDGIIIDGVMKPDYASFLDAKRVIDGKCPMWILEGFRWDAKQKKVVKSNSDVVNPGYVLAN